jgi:hypothetical protein
VTELIIRVDVAAPAGNVWAAVVDWSRQSDWMLGTKVRVTAGDGAGVGSELAAFTGVGALGFVDTMVITRWDPPRLCEVGHTGKVVRGTGVFEVVPMGADRSTLVWTERLTLPLGLLGRLGWPLVRPGFAWGVRYSLGRLAKQVEGRV